MECVKGWGSRNGDTDNIRTFIDIFIEKYFSCLSLSRLYSSVPSSVVVAFMCVCVTFKSNRRDVERKKKNISQSKSIRNR